MIISPILKIDPNGMPLIIEPPPVLAAEEEFAAAMLLALEAMAVAAISTVELPVVTICPDCPECLRLRELGFQDRVEVRKIADGAAIICSVMGMRVAIGRDLGEHVRVEKLAA